MSTVDEVVERLDRLEERIAWIEALAETIPPMVISRLDDLTALTADLRQAVAAVA